MKCYLPDTNTLINQPYFLESLEGEIIVTYFVLQELDKIKMEKGTGRGFKARQAVRVLKKLGDKITYDFDLPQSGNDLYTNNDDRIVASAVSNKATLVTGDYIMQLKAKARGVEVIEVDELTGFDAHIGYTGIKEVYLDLGTSEGEHKLAGFYQDKNSFAHDMLRNQYLILWDLSKPKFNEYGVIVGYEMIETQKFDGESIRGLQYSKIKNNFLEASPINVKQRLMFDMMQNPDITVKTTFGSFGVGKDYVMIAHAIDLVYRRKKSKIIWVRNNIEVKDTKEIGFLPNGMEDKLLPFAMPLADHLGGIEGLRHWEREIEVQHLGFMRGRDIKDSIIYVTECENNTKEHIQLLLGRCGEDSELWLNGDTRQIDSDKFIYNNGVNAVKKLMGQKKYGQVTLDKVERSETAMLADLLED